MLKLREAGTGALSMEMWFDHTGVDDRGIHRKRARPEKGGSALAIDLTPMLDVVMIMLIFFIVAGSFVHEVVVDVQRKQTTSNTESSEPSENITIQIAADDNIWIKNRRVDPKAVRANISRLRAENPKASVIIKAHNKSTVDMVALVIDSSREAGIYRVSLSTGE
jgi:biopolymer transport protein ExbD